MSKQEQVLKEETRLLNLQYPSSSMELDSLRTITVLLNNLDNSKVLRDVAHNQAHVHNYKLYRLMHEEGLRSIILRRNKLGCGFAKQIVAAIAKDKYLKVLDLSGN